MTMVKICGITDRQGALAVVQSGVDMIGFNFYPPSPRYISPNACARLVDELHNDLGSVVRVGVFVNATREHMLRIFEQCKLDLIQLCGDEPSGLVHEMREYAFKAVRPRTPEGAIEDAREYARHTMPPALLLDAWKTGSFGGTGVTGDWEIARAIARDYPVLLAGGLHPGNVAQAVEQVQPWGVDVASGVESAPGRKDPNKIAAFVKTVRTVPVTKGKREEIDE